MDDREKTSIYCGEDLSSNGRQLHPLMNKNIKKRHCADVFLNHYSTVAQDAQIFSGNNTKQKLNCGFEQKTNTHLVKKSCKNAVFSTIETGQKITAIFANFLPISDNY